MFMHGLFSLHAFRKLTDRVTAHFQSTSGYAFDLVVGNESISLSLTSLLSLQAS